MPDRRIPKSQGEKPGEELGQEHTACDDKDGTADEEVEPVAVRVPYNLKRME